MRVFIFRVHKKLSISLSIYFQEHIRNLVAFFYSWKIAKSTRALYRLTTDRQRRQIGIRLQIHVHGRLFSLFHQPPLMQDILWEFLHYLLSQFSTGQLQKKTSCPGPTQPTAQILQTKELYHTQDSYPDSQNFRGSACKTFVF